MVTDENLSKTQNAVLVVLRMALGWHFLYEGLDKVLDPGWTSRGYLSTSQWLFSGFFHWVAQTPGVLKAVDLVNEWALVLIGLGLMTGLLTRAVAAGGSALLLLYYFAHPPFDAVSAVMPGSFLIVDRNLLEAVAMVAFVVLPAESLWGLDRLRRVRQAIPESKPDSLSHRREVLANLVSVPVLGTFVVALLSGKKIRGKVERAADVSRDRDVFVAGATRPAGYDAPLSTNLVSLRDFEKAAQAKMSPAAWEFVDSGAGDDQTSRWNEGAYHQIYLQMRANVDVSRIDTRIHLFGRERPHPIMLSPVSNHNYVHPEAERATARGAGKAGATMIISTFSGDSIETIAKAATAPLWHCTYLMKDRDRKSVV
jgi:thiosulfate dehydrogenase (quinone) large subunit